MFSLDRETADRLAANVLWQAVWVAPSHHYLSVKATAKALLQGGLIDDKTMRYVLLNTDRLIMLPARRFIDPVWSIEANRAEGALGQREMIASA